MTRPTIVCLVGSTRFKEQFNQANYDETLAGRIVLTVGCMMNADHVNITPEQKAMLDQLHLRKIDLCDEVLVLNCKHPRCPMCKVWFHVQKCHVGVTASPTCDCNKDLSPFVAYPREDAPYIGSRTRNEIAYAKQQGKRIRYLHEPEAEQRQESH